MAQPVEAVCDECAGHGQLAYDLQASDDRIGISVLACPQCDGTGTVRRDPGRGNRLTRSGR